LLGHPSKKITGRQIADNTEMTNAYGVGKNTHGITPVLNVWGEKAVSKRAQNDQQ
jgi:hypothetical protein